MALMQVDFFSKVLGMCCQCNVILADEPTGNLDSKNGLEIMELLSQLNAEGTTIVMVTHSQHDAAYANRIINLFDGEVVENTIL